VKISRCIAAALLVGSTTTGCSSCAKDDAAPATVSSDTPQTALTNQKAAPLPRRFERRQLPGMATVAPGAAASGAPVVGDAGSDATTN
jgi:hypothetical protein